MSAFVAGSSSRLGARDVNFARRAKPCASARGAALAMQTSAGGKKRVLVIGGTRFSGLYLTKALADQGHDVVLFNRGSKPVGDKSLMVPGESEEAFSARNERTNAITGDRTNAEELVSLLRDERFDAVYDNNGRELSDSKPLIDLYKGSDTHYIYMSSAGVYLKSDIMPHLEEHAVDPKSRHKGKLDTERYLAESGIRFTSIRPTYIYGALNYNPLEQWFFERLAAGRAVPVPGHGQHLTGLGHVVDLACAMSAVLGNDKTIGQIYNIQDRTAVTFDGTVHACAEAMGIDASKVEIVHYDPAQFKEAFGKKKAFPMRPQHFFTSPCKALADLDWSISYDTAAGLRDSYTNDFVHKLKAGKLKNDFSTDDIVLSSM